LIQSLPPIKEVALGYAHTCALSESGDVWCWGSNALGELGDGTTVSRISPGAPVSKLDETIAIGAGVNNTCAVGRNNLVRCWGTDDPGGVTAEGFLFKTNEPLLLSGIHATGKISNGRNFVCALGQKKALLCWGSVPPTPSVNGEDPNTKKIFLGPRGMAVEILRDGGFVDVSVTAFAGCALAQSADVYCWQLGQREFGKIDGFAGAKKVAVGAEHACALLASNKIKCIGGNDYGQLGDGTTERADTPIEVLGF
ncbi:MAG: hypothetical protein OEM91_15045, partial [Hyphomicrobiales bacterium]|nr:hypothetical protein [Hyphomicrobiales bacterium]